MPLNVPFSKGDLVRSRTNKAAPLFRVAQCGPKRAKVIAVRPGAYFSCYCAPSALRKV